MIGRTLSEYRILEEIGGGGMGVVYKAEDLQLKHVVALKFLPRELTRDSDARERFLQEARAAFSLDHPNICTVHGLGETDDGQIFIVMAYYEGETVKQKISRGPLEIEEARSIVTQTARGLATAHDHGIVHRDIKPANLIVTTDGTVKILDFGLAKLADQTKVTRENTTLGTTSYMSPEQARGEVVDASTDLWSLGAVLYEMLSGQAPFRGDYNEVIIYSIMNTEPGDLSAQRKGIPQDLLEVCGKCLNKQKEKRPGSARLLLDALGAAPSGKGLNLPDIFGPVSPQWGISIFILIVIAGSVLWFLLSSPPVTLPKNPLVAVLPFRNNTGVDSVAEWIEPLQSMVDENFRHLGVQTYDIQSIDGYLRSTAKLDLPAPGGTQQGRMLSQGVGFLIDGRIGIGDSGFTLQIEVQDLRGGSFDRTKTVSFRNFLVAENALFELIPTVTDFLHLTQISGQKIEDLEPWIRGRHSNIQAHKELMQACMFLYRLEPGGEIHLRRAIELDSMFVTPRVWLISGLVTSGNRDEAMTHYRFLRSIQTETQGFEQAMIDWCGSYIQGDIDGQARHLGIALEYSPGNNILIYNLARIRFLEQNFQGTIDVLEPAVVMRWSYSPAYWFYAVANIKLGRYEEARKVLESSLAFSSSVYPENYAYLASLYSRKGDSVRASTYREKFITRTRPRGDSLWIAYAGLGDVYAEIGSADAAIREYRLASDLRPSFPAYHDSLAGLYFRTGRFEAAFVEYETVIRLEPEARHAWFTMGLICEELKRIPCAITHYQTYLTIDSLSARAGEVRQRLSRLAR